MDFDLDPSFLTEWAAGDECRDVVTEAAGEIADTFDQIAPRAPKIAEELFDTGVNMGPAVATAFLQRALNALNRGATDYPDMILDGRIGPATLTALDAFLARRNPAGETVLLKAIEALQGERYVALAETRPANEAFLYGWLANRL